MPLQPHLKQIYEFIRYCTTRLLTHFPLWIQFYYRPPPAPREVSSRWSDSKQPGATEGRQAGRQPAGSSIINTIIITSLCYEIIIMHVHICNLTHMHALTPRRFHILFLFIWLCCSRSSSHSSNGTTNWAQYYSLLLWCGYQGTGGSGNTHSHPLRCLSLRIQELLLLLQLFDELYP